MDEEKGIRCLIVLIWAAEKQHKGRGQLRNGITHGTVWPWETRQKEEENGGNYTKGPSNSKRMFLFFCPGSL